MSAGAFGGQAEGWYTDSESSSSFSSISSSDSDSYASTESSTQSTSTFSSTGRSTTQSQSQSEGQTVTPVWVPIPLEELGSEVEWSREEKLSRVAEMMMTQPGQTAFIKLDDEAKTEPLMVPFVGTNFHSEEYLLEYVQAVYNQQHALPADQVDKIIVDNERKFLATAAEAIDARFTEGASDTPKDKKKRPTRRKKHAANPFDNINLEEE